MHAHAHVHLRGVHALCGDLKPRALTLAAQWGAPAKHACTQLKLWHALQLRMQAVPPVRAA